MLDRNSFIKLGTVTDVDKPKRLCRCKLQDENITTGWLVVLKSPPFIPAKDVPQQTELKGGGSGDPAFESHQHDVIISPWLPDVNDVVLIAYTSGANSDGFVIGAV